MSPEAQRLFEDERRAALDARAGGRHEDALARFEAAQAQRPDDRWIQCDIVHELLALKRPDEAEARARNIIGLAPAFAPAHRCLALALRAKGERAAALDAFRTASRHDGRDLWSRHDVGIELAALGRAGDARAAFDAVVAGAPALAHSLRQIALLASNDGRLEEAASYFQAAALLLPNDPWFALDRARSLEALGRPTDAEAVLADLGARHPAFGPAIHEHARLLAGLGRREEARTLLLRRLVKEAADAQACRGLARLAREDGDTEMALAHLRAARRLHPGDGFLALELGGLLRASGRWAEAEALFRDCLDAPAVAVDARVELASCLKRGANVAAAASLLEDARRHDPLHPRPLLLLADDARERGDLTRANALYDELLGLRPGFYWGLVGKALAARALGRLDASAAFWQEAIRRDPDEGHAQIEWAAERREAGDLGAARALLEAVPAHSPRFAQALMGEGLIRRAEGDWRGAADAFADVARRFPRHVEALVEAAQDWFRANETARADAALAAAQALDADHPALLDALARRALLCDDLGGAQALVQKAASGDPSRLWPPLALARLQAARGDGDGGLARLDAAAARFGPRPEIALAKADLLRQTGRAALADACLSKAALGAPGHMPLRHALVQSAIEAGRFEAAERAIADLPVDAGRTHFLRSLLLAARWDFAGAVAAGEAAVARLPGDGWVRNRLVHAALLDLDLDRAGRHLADLAALDAAASALRGKSANPSQSHYGQIFDEFRLDRDVLEALRAARALAPPERASELAVIVRDNPDSTLAAIQWFLDCRRSGALAPPRPPREIASPIPRRIHQYWDAGALPPDLEAYAASWRALNPDFEYRLWSEAEARAFLARLSPAALRAFDRAAEPAMKADLFRLALLCEEGGLYADADDRCVAGIAPLLEGGWRLVAYQEDLGSLGNNFIAASPRHPVLVEAFERAVEAVDRGDCDILWLSTGPGLLTRAAASCLVRDLGDAAVFRLLDRHEFFAHAAIHCLAAYKATERHWSRTAFGRARKAQATSARSA